MDDSFDDGFGSGLLDAVLLLEDCLPKANFKTPEHAIVFNSGYHYALNLLKEREAMFNG